jgi:hypothetical protein
MKTFKIDKNATIICNSESTRYGFRHLATLMVNGYESGSAKRCYYNRTWESFEFESVIADLLEKTGYLTARKTKNYFRRLRDNNGREVDKKFKRIGAIAKMAAVMQSTEEDKNKATARVLAAAIPELSIPEDFNKLPEAEKTKRLAGVINFLVN